MHGFLRGLFYRREERDDGASVIYPKVHWPFLFPCGHTGPSTYAVEIDGMTFSNRDLDPQGNRPCANCVADDFMNSVIRCVACAKLIIPRQMVAVVYTEPGDATKPGVHLVDGGRQAIQCCVRGDFTGWWNGESVEKV